MNIKITEEKIIEFTVNISGVDPRDITGNFRFLFDGIEYGFPIEVNSNTVTARIPPLKTFINEYKIEKGTKLESRLDVVADDTIISPWNGTLVVDIPVKIEANVKDEDNMIKEQSKPKFTLVNITDDNNKKTNKIDENIKESKTKSRFAIELESIK